MEKITNILVPLDLGDYSSRIVEICKWLSDKIDAYFYFLYVVEEKMMFSLRQMDYKDSQTQSLFQLSRDALDAIIKNNNFDDGKYSNEVILGEPFVEIISKSTTRPPADLIIVGGLSSQGVYKMGDNAFKIIQMAPIPTLLVKEQDDRQSEYDQPFKKILVAMDFSEHSLMALDYVLSLKPVLKGSIHVYQVVSDQEEASQEKVKEKLQSSLNAEQMNEIDHIEVKSSSDPAKEILSKIDEFDFDLLAIGSHSRRRFLRNLFLGKVAYQVVRKASSSVLLFKTPT
jgi:nucleotide-binding universal stress UspA family protein